MRIACLLPAAGASSRMRGGDKLLELVESAACLAVMAKRALAADLEVLVTLPSFDHPRAHAIEGFDVQRILVSDPSEGLSVSLRLAAASLDEDIAGLMILPPDMPALQSDDLKQIATAFRGSPLMIAQAETFDGVAGHPVLFPKRLFSDFKSLSGDRGAFSIVSTEASTLNRVRLQDNRAVLDLDTPEAWAEWRAMIS